MIEVSDNYDDDVTVGFTGEVDIHKEGTYEIKVSATDKSKNKSTKTISIIIKGKEVIVEKVEVAVPTPDTQQNQPNNQSNGNQITQPDNGSTNAPIVSNQPAYQWLFQNGYTRDSAFSACKTYRGTGSGSCSPLVDAEGINYGYEYIPY